MSSAVDEKYSSESPAGPAANFPLHFIGSPSILILLANSNEAARKLLWLVRSARRRVQILRKPTLMCALPYFVGLRNEFASSINFDWSEEIVGHSGFWQLPK